MISTVCQQISTGVALLWLLSSMVFSQTALLQQDDYRHYVDRFAANDDEYVQPDQAITNAAAWEWMKSNIPFLDCPSTEMEETYYFRWWSFRKHIKHTGDGLLLTEFFRPVSHAGKHNTIACAVGHHIAEARWLSNHDLVEQYARFWYRSGPERAPAPHLHKFSGWIAAALYDDFLVSGNSTLCIDLLDDLIRDDEAWIAERRLPGGLFWQYDVRDGMEESISGGRKVMNARPTINSYMAANARALSQIATLAGRNDVAKKYSAEFVRRRELLLTQLWDEEAQFFKVRLESGKFSDAREAIGFIPWMFSLPEQKHLAAWQQLKDPQGFWAPMGLTTAERRHPAFRTHGEGTCEWDGAVWPFATSQTLNGLIQVLQSDIQQPYVSKADFLNQMLIYAHSHQQNGLRYIGEYHDESTGRWLISGPKAERSRYYNHSTFADLIIRGLVGVVPRADGVVEINPLVTGDAWRWFCLDRVPYHGGHLSIQWDRDGTRYHRGSGLQIFVNDKLVHKSEQLQRVEISEVEAGLSSRR